MSNESKRGAAGNDAISGGTEAALTPGLLVEKLRRMADYYGGRGEHPEYDDGRSPDIVTTLTQAANALSKDSRDAARYRYLRVNSTGPVEPWSTHDAPESLDAAVDAAMEAK